MSARAVAHVLFRHYRPMLAVFLLCLALGGGAALRPPSWRAEAVVRAEAVHAEGIAVETLGDGRLRLSVARADGPAALAGLVAVLEALQAPAPDDPATAALARQAAEARQKVEAWRHRNGTSDAAADLRRRAELEGEATAAEAEAAALADKLAMLKARLATTPATIQLSSDRERSRVIDEAKAKLFEMQTREQELLGKYQPTSPLVQNLQAERRRVEELLKGLDTPVEARVRSGANEVYQDLEKEAFRTEAALTAARGRGKALTRQMAELDRRMESAGGGGRLDRVATDLETRLAARRAALHPAPVAVVEPPRLVPPPPRSAALAAGLAAGLLLGLAAAFAADRLSTRFATPADVERRLGLPVLTVLSREG
ncbi:MAG: hypothetical protein HYU60_06890 [Magnetospirillum sp.]|nr:hypothetical protein [Magnetospirillum sp.]